MNDEDETAAFARYAALDIEAYNAINELNTIIMNKIYTQMNGEVAIKARRYIVGSLSATGEVSFAVHPTTHASASDARSECARLAKENPGRTFLFVQLVGAERTVAQPSIVSI